MGHHGEIEQRDGLLDYWWASMEYCHWLVQGHCSMALDCTSTMDRFLCLDQSQMGEEGIRLDAVTRT